MNNLPHIKILILNWNGSNVIKECIDSVTKLSYPNYSVTVIDNGSTDNSLNLIENNYSDLEIIRIGNNLGYAKGYNYAFDILKDNKSDFYLLLNNDTSINENLLDVLYENIIIYGNNNIYSPKIMYADNPNKVWYAGGKVNSFLGLTKHIGIGEEERLMKFKTQETDYISGCCLLIKKDLLDKLSGFIENYIMYYEDVDLCYRAKKYNAQCIVVEDTKILHKVSHSLGENKIKKQWYKLCSMLKYIYLNNNIVFSLIALVCHVILTPIYILKVIYEEV